MLGKAIPRNAVNRNRNVPMSLPLAAMECLRIADVSSVDLGVTKPNNGFSKAMTDLSPHC